MKLDLYAVCCPGKYRPSRAISTIIQPFFGLEYDKKDEVALKTLARHKIKRSRSIPRKKSFEYNLRSARLSKRKIETNIAARKASQARRDQRSYTSIAGIKN